MSTRTPYPSYKPSGIDWVGDMPGHWKATRFSRLTTAAITGKTPPSENRGYYDSPDPIRWFGPSDLRGRYEVTDSIRTISHKAISERMATLVTGPAIIVSIIGSPGVARLVPSGVFTTNQQLVSFPVSQKNIPKFLIYLMELTSPFLAASASTSTIPILSVGEIRRLSILLPPLDEQRAIADYLDRKDAQITRFIESRRRMIALLEEKKQAIINQAVTRGLDPTVPMKDSGVEWLGEIPAHWETRRLKHIVVGVDQGVSPQSEAGLAGDGSWGVLKSGCVNGGVFRQSEHKRLPDDFRVDPTLKVMSGDLLVSRASGSRKFVGSAGLVMDIDYNLILSDKTFRLRIPSDILNRFLQRSMNSTSYREQVEQAISGAEGLANNLPLSSLREFVFAVPPNDEQVSIVKYLYEIERRIVQQKSRYEHEIKLIEEYRARLISDVVTGKVRVE